VKAQEVKVMTEPVPSAAVEPPDISHLVFEDGKPLDSMFSERQMQLLVDSLYASWDGGGHPFLAFMNVGLFYALHGEPVVPDVMVSLDVTPPRDATRDENKSYLVWQFGKPPEIAVEIVSNRTGGELEKLEKYGDAGVCYVIVYDPMRQLRGAPLRIFTRHGDGWVDTLPNQVLGDVGLAITTWYGSYRGLHDMYLRWCDADGNLLLTADERAETERVRAETERVRAETERERAETERERADAAEARLRELQARLDALERGE
jgi:Uma2 family endonuclease